MGEYQGQERRKTPRKEVYLPIRLTADENVISTGHILNLSCYGLKVEITFKTTEERPLVDKILETHDITLEIGKAGDKLYLKTPVKVKWKSYRYGEGEKIYEAGLDLKLSEENKEAWQQFYDKI